MREGWDNRKEWREIERERELGRDNETFSLLW